jgi:hypothetical protein
MNTLYNNSGIYKYEMLNKGSKFIFKTLGISFLILSFILLFYPPHIRNRKSNIPYDNIYGIMCLLSGSYIMFYGHKVIINTNNGLILCRQGLTYYFKETKYLYNALDNYIYVKLRRRRGCKWYDVGIYIHNIDEYITINSFAEHDYALNIVKELSIVTQLQYHDFMMSQNKW